MKEFIIVYFSIISIISIILTVKDKYSAIKGRCRVPEKTLMLIGLLGGAISMYITMLVIRHKTKHIKFMIGLPLEIILHLIIIIAVVFLI